MMGHEELLKKMDDLKEIMSNEMNDPAKVQATKDLVDQLIIDLNACCVQFILKHEAFRGNGLLAAMVVHRAMYFMSTVSTHEWTMDAVMTRFILHSEKKAKVCHVID